MQVRTRKARRQLTVNSRPYTTICSECDAMMLPNSAACRRCGGLALERDMRTEALGVADRSQPGCVETLPAASLGELRVAEPSPTRYVETAAPAPAQLPASVAALLEAAAPEWARPNPDRVPTMLGCWPLGALDLTDHPTTTALTRTAQPARHLEPVAGRGDVPAQRREMESVPSIGPNPFLAAARILAEREAAQAV
ncbi:MAG TPA: hypothetical protein VHB69_13025 [Mycobacteriales bacterium]|nr:hypothetical protein [Mycobacteriales bacterium]